MESECVQVFLVGLFVPVSGLVPIFTLLMSGQRMALVGIYLFVFLLFFVKTAPSSPCCVGCDRGSEFIGEGWKR